MHTACSINCFTNRVLPNVIEMAQQAGYTSVELYADDVQRHFGKALEHKPQFVHLMDEAGVALAGVGVGRFSAERPDQRQLQAEQLCNAIGYASSLGASTISFEGGSRTLENFNELTAVLPELLKAATDSSARLAIANAVRTRIENPTDLAAVYTDESLADLGVVVDVGQCHLASVNPIDVIHQMRSRIVLVRLADMLGDRYVPFGQGEVNLDNILTSLRDEAGYDGPLVLNPPRAPGDDPLVYLVQAREYVESRLT